MKEKEQYIKNKIINALLNLLYEKELTQIKADEIASKATVSKRTLYKYYETKTAMYLGVVHYCFSDMNKQLEKSFESFEKTISLKQMEVMCRAYLNYMVENPQKAKIIIFFNEQDYLKDYPEITGKIVLEANKYEPMKFFRELSEQKSDSEFSKESLAIHVHSTIFGLSLLLQSKRYWLEGYFGKTVEEIIDENVNMLMKLFTRTTDDKVR